MFQSLNLISYLFKDYCLLMQNLISYLFKDYCLKIVDKSEFVSFLMINDINILIAVFFLTIFHFLLLSIKFNFVDFSLKFLS